MSELVFEDFEAHVGANFTLDEEPFPPLQLVLETAKLLPQRDSPASRPAFTLLFRCADPRILPQQIYRIAHQEMGSVSLFLVPVGQDEAGVKYESLFN